MVSREINNSVVGLLSSRILFGIPDRSSNRFLTLKKSVNPVAQMLISLRFKGFFRLFDPTNPWLDGVRTTQEQLSTHPGMDEALNAP